MIFFQFFLVIRKFLNLLWHFFAFGQIYRNYLITLVGSKSYFGGNKNFLQSYPGLQNGSPTFCKLIGRKYENKSFTQFIQHLLYESNLLRQKNLKCRRDFENFEKKKLPDLNENNSSNNNNNNSSEQKQQHKFQKRNRLR